MKRICTADSHVKNQCVFSLSR